MVFGLVYVQLPFMVLPLYAALDRLDRSLLEASLDLGAGHLTTFARVVVPLAMPGIVSGVLVTLIPSVGAYLTPGPARRAGQQMIANVIERQFKTANDWPFGAALSFLLMYMTFLAIAVQAIVVAQPQARRGADDRAPSAPPGPLEYLRRWPIRAWLVAVVRLPLRAAGHPDGVQLQRQPAQHRLARLHARLVQRRRSRTPT